MHEVYPVCKYNLWSVAGEWAGFDRDWLKAKILGRLNSPFRIFHRLSRNRLDAHTSAEWQATKVETLASRLASLKTEPCEVKPVGA